MLNIKDIWIDIRSQENGYTLCVNFWKTGNSKTYVFHNISQILEVIHEVFKEKKSDIITNYNQRRFY